MAIFMSMGGVLFVRFCQFVSSRNEISKEWQRFLSLTLLMFSFVIALLPHEQRVFGGLWVRSFSIAPDLISSLLGLVMLTPLYLRGILKWNRSVFTTVSFFLILGVFSSFVNLVFAGLRGGFFGTLNFYIVLIAILLSWVGMRGVAGVAWMVVLIFGVCNVYSASLALGFYGYLYFSCATVGLCLHSGLNPGELIDGFRVEYGSKALNAKNSIAEDIKMTATRSGV